MQNLSKEQKTFLKMDILIFLVISIVFTIVRFMFDASLDSMSYLNLIFVGAIISFLVKALFAYLNNKNKESIVFSIFAAFFLTLFSYQFLIL